MTVDKKEVEKRKMDLQKQHDDLSTKIRQGEEAINNMRATLIGVKGAISQCDWTISLFKEEKNEK